MRRLFIIISLLAVCLLLAACTHDDVVKTDSPPAAGKATDMPLKPTPIPAPETVEAPAPEPVVDTITDTVVEIPVVDSLPDAVAEADTKVVERDLPADELTEEEAYNKVHEFEEIALDLLGEGIITEEQFVDFSVKIDLQIEAIDTASADELKTIVSLSEQYWLDLMKEVQG